jgi:hypothetical protein
MTKRKLSAKPKLSNAEVLRRISADIRKIRIVTEATAQLPHVVGGAERTRLISRIMKP